MPTATPIPTAIQRAIDDWADRTAISPDGRLRVVLEYLGEGWNGEFNPSRPSDAPLVRFTVAERDHDGDFQDLEGSSFCTSIPITTPPALLDAFAARIMARVVAGLVGKDLAPLTWVTAADLV